MSHSKKVENLLILSRKLAFNHVSGSFPRNKLDKAAEEIFKDFANFQSEANRTRNILVVGAGASHDVDKGILLAKDAIPKIKTAFEVKYSKDITILVDKELERLTNVYKLTKTDFETQLLAYSKFDKDLVLTELRTIYMLRYPVSFFYESVAHLLKHRFLDVIINFNFDEILDNAIEEEMQLGEYKFIYSDGHCPEKGEEERELLINGRLRRPVYIKPHGTISHASTLRFTREDYFNMLFY